MSWRRLSSTELATQSLVTSGGVSLRLNRLEDAGLVERIRGRQDRRAVGVRLTEKGDELVSRVARHHFAREAELLSDLSDDEQRVLSDLLRRLFHSLNAGQAPA